MGFERSSRWPWAVFAWIGVIFFSSTSLALKWAEATYKVLSHLLLRDLDASSQSYSLYHLLADKGFHVALFCILAILLWRTLLATQNKTLLILLAGAVVGSCSEFLQRFFPDRDPAIRDVMINIGGTALGIGICLGLARLQKRRREEPTPQTANV